MRTFLLAACTIYDPASPTRTSSPPGNFKAGSGRSTRWACYAERRTPFAGFTCAWNATGTQSVDVDKCTFLAGEFVDLTNDGRVVRLSGTSLNQALRNAMSYHLMQTASMLLPSASSRNAA